MLKKGGKFDSQDDGRSFADGGAMLDGSFNDADSVVDRNTHHDSYHASHFGSIDA